MSLQHYNYTLTYIIHFFLPLMFYLLPISLLIIIIIITITIIIIIIIIILDIISQNNKSI